MNRDLRRALDDEPMRPFQWLAVAVCIVLNLIDGFDVLVMAFTASSVAAEWNLGGAEIGLLLSAGLFGMAAGSLFIAPWADRWGRRPLILACLALSGLGMLASALSQASILRVLGRARMRYHAASFSYACISTMHCPFCGAHDTKVIDSRLVAEGDQVRRRRECLACGERFTTFETAELVMPRLIKQDGSRQPFDEDKLRAGMQRALEKRPVSVERLEAAIGHIKHQLRATGEREIKSRVLGELVMAELQKLDEVAYIRFASVYRRFQDLNEFREEIERLAREPAKE